MKPRRSTDRWFFFKQSSTSKQSPSSLKQQTDHYVTGWYNQGHNHATIATTQFNAASGSVVTFMSKASWEPVDELEYFDEIDAEVARMSDAEIIEAIKTSAGMWADRDDLDELMDRSDRIDELYGHTSNNSDSAI